MLLVRDGIEFWHLFVILIMIILSFGIYLLFNIVKLAILIMIISDILQL